MKAPAATPAARLVKWLSNGSLDDVKQGLDGAVAQLRALCVTERGIEAPRAGLDHVPRDPLMVDQWAAASAEADELFALLTTRPKGSTSALDAQVIEVVACLVEMANTSTTRAFGISLCRRIIRQHLRHVYHALGDENPAHREAALHLLTSMILSNSAIARELQQAFNYGLESLLKACTNASPTVLPSPLDPSLVGVRGHMAGFLLAHLMGDELSGKRDLLALVQLTNALFRGLSNDAPDMAIFILDALRQHVVYDGRLSRQAKHATFNPTAIEHLLPLLQRNERAGARTVAESAEAFLLDLLAVPGRGLCAPDQGATKPMQRLVGLFTPTDDLAQQRVILRMMAATPALVPFFWSQFGVAADPRPSLKWLSACALLVKTVCMEPPALGPSAPSAAQRQPSAAWLAAFVLPPWFAKTSATQALQHSNRLVKYTALTVLDACFSKLAAIAARFGANAAEMSAAADADSQSASSAADEDGGDFDPARLLRDLLQELRRRLPDLQLLVALLSSLRPTLSVAEEEASPMLLYQRLLAVLAGYQRFLPDLFIEGRYEMGKFIPEGPGALEALGPAAHFQLCRLLARAPISSWIKQHGTNESLQAIVRLYATASHDVVAAALERLLCAVLTATQLFEHHPAEALVWVRALPRGGSHDAIAEAAAFFDACVADAASNVYRHMDRTSELMQQLREASDATDATRLHVLDRSWAAFSPFLVCAWDLLVKRGHGRSDQAARFVAAAVADLRTELDPCEWLFELLRGDADAALWKAVFAAPLKSASLHFNAVVEEAFQSGHFDVAAQHRPLHQSLLSRAARLGPLETEHALRQASRLLRFTQSALLCRLWQALLARLRATAPARFQTVAASIVSHPAFAHVDALIDAPDSSALVFALCELALAGLLPEALTAALRRAIAARAMQPTASSSALTLCVAWARLFTADERASVISALLSRLAAATATGKPSKRAAQVLAVLLQLLGTQSSAAGERNGAGTVGAAALPPATLTSLLALFQSSAHPAVTRVTAAIFALQSPAAVATADGSALMEPAAPAADAVVAGCLAHPLRERLLLLAAFLASGGAAARQSLLKAVVAARDRWEAIAPRDRAALLAVAVWAASGLGRPARAATAAELAAAADDDASTVAEWVARALEGATASWCADVAAAAVATAGVQLVERVRADAAPLLKGAQLPAWAGVLLAAAWGHGARPALSPDAALRSPALSAAVSVEAWIDALLAGAASAAASADDVQIAAAAFVAALAEHRDAVLAVCASSSSALEQLITLARTAGRVLAAGTPPASMPSLGPWLFAAASLIAALRERPSAPLPLAVRRCCASAAAFLLEQAAVRFYLEYPSSLRAPLASFVSAVAIASGDCEWATSFHAAAVLRAYHTTTGAADRALLALLVHFDRRPRTSALPPGGFSLLHVGIIADDAPFGSSSSSSVFDPLATRDFPRLGAQPTSVDTAATTLLQAVRPLRMLCAVLSFEPARSRCADAEEDAYDPDYFLPLAMHVLLGRNGPRNDGGGGSSASHDADIRRFIEANWAGLLVVALSAADARLRRAACAGLAALRAVLVRSRLREASQLLALLDALRNALEPPSEEAQGAVPQVPYSVAHFVALALPVMLKPEHAMYPLINKFILQRPTIDLEDVPMYYALYYDSSTHFRSLRQWILRMLASGLKDARDWRLYRRRHVYDALTTLYDSGIADAPARRLILECLERATQLPFAGSDLVRRAGLLTWLAMQCRLVAPASSGEHARQEVAALVVVVRMMRAAVYHLSGLAAPSIGALCSMLLDALAGVAASMAALPAALHGPSVLLFAEVTETAAWITKRFMPRRPLPLPALTCLLDRWASLSRRHAPAAIVWDDEGAPAADGACEMLRAHRALAELALSAPTLLADRTLAFAADFCLSGTRDGAPLAAALGEWVVMGVASHPRALTASHVNVLALLFRALRQARLAPDAQPRAASRLLCGALVLANRAGPREQRAHWDAALAIVARALKGSALEVSGPDSIAVESAVVRALCRAQAEADGTAAASPARRPAKRRKHDNGAL